AGRTHEIVLGPKPGERESRASSGLVNDGSCLDRVEDLGHRVPDRQHVAGGVLELVLLARVHQGRRVGQEEATDHHVVEGGRHFVHGRGGAPEPTFGGRDGARHAPAHLFGRLCHDAVVAREITLVEHAQRRLRPVTNLGGTCGRGHRHLLHCARWKRSVKKSVTYRASSGSRICRGSLTPRSGPIQCSGADRPFHRMGFVKRYTVRLAILGLLVLVGVLVVYRIKDQQARAVTRIRPDVLVGTLKPERRDLEIKLAFTADILAAQQAAIFSKVSGYIRRIHAERGDFVKAGQVLAEIDDLELRAAVDQARATLQTGEAGFEVARSTLEGNRANLENQRANLTKARAVADNDARQAERMKTLFERGLVAATEFENARTSAESSRAGVQAAEAQLRVAEVQIATAESQMRLAQAQVQSYRAALQLAETNLANTRLLAPFSGYVAQRNLDSGAAVSAQSAGTNTASVGILTLQDIHTVKVQIEVPERNIARVTVGSLVRLSVDPYQGEVFTGSVARVVHNLDPRSRTMGVEVEIPNPGGRLKPGLFARVEVLVETRRGALCIPSEAIRLGEAQPSVVVVRDGIVEVAPVEVGAADNRGVEIVKGLGDREQVILQGKDLVKPKQKVRTTAASSP